MHEQIERVALAGDHILNATQDQRAAMARLTCPHFIEGQPARADDAFIKLAPGFKTAQFTTKGEAQVGNILVRMLPAVDADQLQDFNLCLLYTSPSPRD